ESVYLFTQLFEAAEERLVLSRVTEDNGRPLSPSPFWRAVEQCVALPALERMDWIVTSRQAAARLGQALASQTSNARSFAEIWPIGAPCLEQLLYRITPPSGYSRRRAAA